MNRQPISEPGHTISRLRSAVRTGSLRAVIGELTTICEEITSDKCSELTRMLPRLSVETARISVRIGE